jgi:UDP-N-acetylmuramyl pentapeptide phosphotransferase/UDP-N-acetylglucosamine-1-phosphate transferase
MFYHAFIALAAFIITLLGTRLVILRLRAKPMLPEFSRQSNNLKFPLPRGGGVAIGVALSSYLIATDASYALIGGLVVLGGIAFIGEWVTVPTLVRLLTQLFVISSIVHIEGFTLGLPWLDRWADMLVILLGWLWFMNLYNAMNGIDGLAAVESLCVTIGICLVLSMVERVDTALFSQSLVMAATASGFLWWNWPPARIALGRVGSQAFGVVVGYALLSLITLGYLPSALILASYFLMESLLTNLKSLMKDWGSEHYYLLAARSHTPHHHIIRHVFGVNVLLIALAVFAALYPERAIYTLFAAMFAVGIVLLFFERLYHQKNQANQSL